MGRIPRRAFLQFSLSTVLGLDLLQATGTGRTASAAPRGADRRVKPVIVLYQAGGPPKEETFDPRPASTVEEIRGPFGSIETSLAGVRYGELFPRLAARANKVLTCRSLDSGSSDHFTSARNMLLDQRNVTLGFRLGQQAAHRSVPYLIAKVPSIFSVMDSLQTSRALESTWTVTKPAKDEPSSGWQRDLASEGYFAGPQLEADPRLPARLRLLDQLDTAELHGEAVERARANYLLARELLSGGGGAFSEAFRPPSAEQAEYDRDLDRYGRSTVTGHGLLLARRLVERGAGFVVIYNERGLGWDMHSNLADRVRPLADATDRAASALIDDMDNGLVDCVFVVVGEFGRTPRVNSSGGRDHWGEGFPALCKGGKFKEGTVIGSTDDSGRIRDGEIPVQKFANAIIAASGAADLSQLAAVDIANDLLKQ